MGVFQAIKFRNRVRDIKNRYPDHWGNGEKLFFDFDSKRNPADRREVSEMLFGDGLIGPGWSDGPFHGGLLRDAFAPLDSHGAGVDLEGLTEMEAKLYFIALDGFSPDEVTEMAEKLVSEVHPTARRGYPLGEDDSDFVMALGFINAYLRRRLGVAGF